LANRQPAQASVEAALAALLFGILVAMAVQVGFWAYADNISLAAAQEAARAASAQGSDLAHGLKVGNALLQSGLGPSARIVTLSGHEDTTSVTINVSGGWPLGLGTTSPLSLPLDNEVRMLKQVWTP
jgi:TadE-like protein